MVTRRSGKYGVRWSGTKKAKKKKRDTRKHLYLHQTREVFGWCRYENERSNHKQKVKIEQRMEHQGQVQEVKDPARDDEARGINDAYTMKKEDTEKDVKDRTHVDLAQE